MKKLLNAPCDYADQTLDGLCLAHPEFYARGGASGRVIHRPGGAIAGKVGVVSGGGSGHLPVFTGYCGEGLLDACAIGNVFAGPSVADCIEAMKLADGGAGVLRLYGNYGGDRMNFDMAGEMLELEGLTSTTVLVADDVASAGPEEAAKRRGVAGMVYAFKIAGAKAAAGASLAEVTAAAQKAADACRSIGVALTPCTVPEAGRPTFDLAADEMEMGMGIHGEPGLWRGRMKSADEVAGEMLDRLLADRPLVRGDRISLMVNSLGATPHEELYIKKPTKPHRSRSHVRRKIRWSGRPGNGSCSSHSRSASPVRRCFGLWQAGEFRGIGGRFDRGDGFAHAFGFHDLQFLGKVFLLFLEIVGDGGQFWNDGGGVGAIRQQDFHQNGGAFLAGPRVLIAGVFDERLHAFLDVMGCQQAQAFDADGVGKHLAAGCGLHDCLVDGWQQRLDVVGGEVVIHRANAAAGAAVFIF